MNKNKPPLLVVKNNTIVGISKTKRKPMYENVMCEVAGLIATCNSCDRIIFEDEKWKKGYVKNGGYCKECSKEI